MNKSSLAKLGRLLPALPSHFKNRVMVWVGQLELSQRGFWSSNVFTRNGQVVAATREVLRLGRQMLWRGVVRPSRLTPLQE